MPAKRPCASSAAAPAKSRCRRGFERAEIRRDAELDADRRGCRAASLHLRIGDADERDICAAQRRAEQSDRRKISRTIDAQERELAASVGGNAFGIADARQRDDVATVNEIAVGQHVARRRDEQPGAVFDLAARRVGHACQREARGKRHERARHRRHQRVHGAFHRLVVEDGDAAHLAVAGIAAHDHLLQPLHAGDDERFRLNRAALDTAARQLLLLLEHALQCRAGVDAECFDLQLALLRGPARAVGAGRLLVASLAGQADARSGDRVFGEPPADRLLARRDRGRKRRALRRAHHACDRILVPRLVGLHGLHQPLAELAVDRSAEIAAPGQVVLDRHAIGHRDCGVSVLQAGGLCRRALPRGAAGGRGLLLFFLGGRRLGLRRGGLVLACRRRPSAPRPASAWLFPCARILLSERALPWPWRRPVRPGPAGDWPAGRSARAPPNTLKLLPKSLRKRAYATPKRQTCAP